ncbi:MAG: hypothetical protein IKB92_01510 [Clostridia bacterium]|nr:hypothetical protein [Clostridia bacterium]
MNEKLKELDGRLFSNVGANIKKVTKIVFWVETACSLIAAIIMLFIAMDWEDERLLIGTLSCLVAPVLFWLGSLAMYGFGELVDRVIKISEKN